MRGPDFIIAGAARSGTTWLYEVLDKHADIYLAKPIKPEPKFFLIDDIYSKGFEFYKKNWFGHFNNEKIIGEKSTNYLEGENVACRIYKYLPNVKLIFFLREPAERAFSNFLWSRLNGYERESFSDALKLEKKRERAYSIKLKYARPYSYYSRGLYFKLLKPYFDLFPNENILCLNFEHIYDSPNNIINRVFGFLGVKIRTNLVDHVGVINSARDNDEFMDKNTKQHLMERYAPENRKLGGLLGEDFQVWYK